MAGGDRKKAYLDNKPKGIELGLTVPGTEEQKPHNFGASGERVKVETQETLLDENSELTFKEESQPTQKSEKKEKKSAAEREKKKEEKKSKQKSQNDTEDKSEASSGGDVSSGSGGGVSSGGGGAGGAGPSISASGASSGSVSQKSESQLTSKKVVINLFYSIFDDGELDGAGKKTIGEQVENGSMGKMDYHVDAFHSGDPTEEDRHFTYVECGGLLYDVTSESVDDNEGMNACLGFGIDQIIDTLQGIKDNEHSSYDVTINLAGYDLNEGLVQIAKHIFSGDPPERIKNKEYNLLTDADKKYLQVFTDLKADSFSFGTGYICVYEAQEILSAKSKEREMKLFREQLEWAETAAELGCNGSIDFAGCYSTEFNKSMGNKTMSPSEKAHFMLGIGSLCFFYPPFAFACLAIDLTLHIIECAAYTVSNNKKETVEHFKGAALDFIFILPIGKAIKAVRSSRLIKPLANTTKALTKELAAISKIEARLNKVAPYVNKIRSKLPSIKTNVTSLEDKALSLEIEAATAKKSVENAENAIRALEEQNASVGGMLSGNKYGMVDDVIRENNQEIFRIRNEIEATLRPNYIAKNSVATAARADANTARAYMVEAEKVVKSFDETMMKALEQDLDITDKLTKASNELAEAEKNVAAIKTWKMILPDKGLNANMMGFGNAIKNALNSAADVKVEHMITLRRLIQFGRSVFSKENMSNLAKYLRDPETIQGYLGDAVTINGMLPNGPQKNNAVSLGGATMVTEDWSWSEVPGLAWESFKDDVKKIPSMFSGDDEAETGESDSLIPEGETITKEEMIIQMKQSQYLDTHLTPEQRMEYYEDSYWMDLPDSNQWKDSYVDFNSPTPGQPVYPEDWHGPSPKTLEARQHLHNLEAGVPDEPHVIQFNSLSDFMNTPPEDIQDLYLELYDSHQAKE